MPQLPCFTETLSPPNAISVEPGHMITLQLQDNLKNEILTFQSASTERRARREMIQMLTDLTYNIIDTM